MADLVRKLKSRKLWLALGGMFAGIAMVFGVDSGELCTVAGAVTTAASAVAYILAEGKVDAASAGQAADRSGESR